MSTPRSRGSASVELVLMTPVVVLLALLAAQVGRDAEVAHGVRLAADHASRSASMVRRSSMSATAHRAVAEVLNTMRPSCPNPGVTVHVGFDDVAVEVACGVRLGTVRARSTEVIDRYRSSE
jgi:Flp pilus assembly protein TadG